MATKGPYEGPEKLLIGIDCGTTSSAVSIAHLALKSTPVIHSITSWPGHPNESKLPSLVSCDTSGRAVAFGAECLTPGLKTRAHNEDPHLAEWFKLHLHPRLIQIETTATLASTLTLDRLSLDSTPKQIVPDFDVPPLPPNVTIDLVYSSFFKYVLENTRKWFVENTVGGEGIWRRLASSAEFVCGIPDGWDDVQQVILRKAFVPAGILEDVECDWERLEFIGVAEASVHFALKSNEVREWLEPGTHFTVADAGGSTVDVCMYVCEAISPTVRLREVKLSDCVQAGGIFVVRAAETLLMSKLAGSRFAEPEKLATIVRIFEENTKRKLTVSSEASIIKFGGTGDNDARVGVQMGHGTLSSAECKSTFEFCVNEIIASIKQQDGMGSSRSSKIILAGGFGESPYLRSCLQAAFEPAIPISTDSEPSQKAVSEGTILWHLSQALEARAVRATYGVPICLPYDPESSLQQGRHTYVSLDGIRRVSGFWSTIIPKGTIMKTSEPIERLTLPGFAHKCTINADLSQLSRILVPFQRGTAEVANEHDITQGKVYWRVKFSSCIFVAEASLKAKLHWMAGGILREGPASVVITESIHRDGGAEVRRKPADTLARRA